MDDETLRLRFFAVNRTAGHHYVDHVLGGRPGPLVSLVATGVLRYELSTEASEEFLTAAERRRRLAEGRAAHADADAHQG